MKRVGICENLDPEVYECYKRRVGKREGWRRSRAVTTIPMHMQKNQRVHRQHDTNSPLSLNIIGDSGTRLVWRRIGVPTFTAVGLFEFPLCVASRHTILLSFFFFKTSVMSTIPENFKRFIDRVSACGTTMRRGKSKTGQQIGEKK